MANISKVKIGNTSYNIKDAYARDEIVSINEFINNSLSSALIYKGTVSTASELTSKTNYETGWCYKASERFYLEVLGWVDIGDMIIAQSDFDSSFKVTDWTVIQNNTDIFIGATAENNGSNGLVPAPGTSDINKFLKANGQWTAITVTTDDIEQGTKTLVLDCGTSTSNISESINFTDLDLESF